MGNICIGLCVMYVIDLGCGCGYWGGREDPQAVTGNVFDLLKQSSLNIDYQIFLCGLTCRYESVYVLRLGA